MLGAASGEARFMRLPARLGFASMTQRETPRWQLTKTPRGGYWLCAAWSTLAVLAWLRVIVEGAGILSLLVAVGWTALGLAYGLSALTLSRRQTPHVGEDGT
jgi:hypothetical protein